MSYELEVIYEAPAPLHEFTVQYLDAKLERQSYTLTSKSVPNALASFDRAVRDHGRILGIRKVTAG